ncbi:MAG: hypothetical protein ACRD8Z_07470 [Nitrososphaeraceae archaeon]
MKKKEFYRGGDIDTKKNSGAKAGVYLRNLNHNKDKFSANQGTSAASGSDWKLKALSWRLRSDLRTNIITRISRLICIIR